MLARALSLPVRDDDGAAEARRQSPKRSIAPHVPPEMEVIGVHGRTVRVAFHRRRHHGRRVIPGLSAATAISSAAVLLIVLLALLSLLAPPLPEQHTFPDPRGHVRSRRRHSSSIPIQGRNGIERSLLEEEIFQVPKAGWSFVHDLWRSNLSEHYRGCSNASSKFAAEASAHPNRYLMIATSGGLNQQRTGIIDAVVAARILNATLVVPRLDQKSFWKDASDFSEIFDVDWFISSLSKDIRIIKQLPIRGEKAFVSPYSMRVPRKCTPNCYQKHVLPVLVKRHVVQLTKFDYRLSNKLETDLQKLRCRVNYHALKFTDSIRKMGDTLIQRMKMKSKHFIALHLRFEPDMLAFSGCYYGGGDKEKRELGAIRKRWKTLHNNNPEKERRQGKCPLSPEEVGLMLRSLGFGSDVHLYVASGEIYGGEETLAPLRALFPNFHSKETLASKEELAPFKAFSSRMAALDFIVCDGSDVFVTNNNGNMARILAGRRRYFGHKRTIRPNAKKLHVLFMSRDNMTWETFASKVHKSQRGFMGEPNEVKLGQGEFHENPLACICENSGAKMTHPNFERQNTSSRQRLNHNDKQQANGYLTDEELESYSKNNDNNSMGKRPSDEAELDYDLFINHEDLYFEERFSD